MANGQEASARGFRPMANGQEASARGSWQMANGQEVSTQGFQPMANGQEAPTRLSRGFPAVWRVLERRGRIFRGSERS